MKTKRFLMSILLGGLGLSLLFSSVVLGQTPEPPPAPDGDQPAAAEALESSSGSRFAEAENAARLAGELLAFEEALLAGPTAVVALRDSLSPEALDILMDDIQAAEIALATAALPRASTAQVTLADEEAHNAAQRAEDAAARSQALSATPDLAEGQGPALEVRPSRAESATAVDRTVGAGCTYPSIASALAAANPGDRLLLEGGRTFNENIVISIDITLQGGYAGCASGLPTDTTLDGGGTNRVIDIARDLQVSLINLNLTNGDTTSEGGAIRFAVGTGGSGGALTLDRIILHHNSATYGGGLWVGPDATVLGNNVQIHDNSATQFGGGVRLFGGSATFSQSNIYHNSASSGAGVFASAEFGSEPTLSLPSSTDVYQNQASNLGGGVYLREGGIDLADCSDIYENDSTSGGGAYLITSTLTMEGSCSEIQYNETTDNGGGIYAQGSTINLDNAAEIYDNTAGSDGSGRGGGVYLDDSDLFSDRSVLRYNTADDDGGGIYAINGSVVDFDLGSYLCTATQCSVLSHNTSTNEYGGGIYAYQSTVDVQNTAVEDNTSRLGGGMYMMLSTLTLHNSLLAENAATSNAGDAIRLYTGTTMTANGNTLAYNDSGGAATGEAVALFSANMTLGCSVIWGHTTSINGTTASITYSDIEGGFAGTGNINVNPQFVSAAAHDYHLSVTSPLIDRCAAFAGMDTDFENDARPIMHIAPATPYDMGADEFAIPHVGINGSGCMYNTLQGAVATAADGDAIQIASGTYYENADISDDRELDITGGYDAGCTVADSGVTTLDGSYNNGSVFDIYAATVNLYQLDITGGNLTTGGGIDIRSGAQVTLDEVRVHHNQGTFGGGIYVGSGSAVTLTHDSDVDHNTATTLAGGIRVADGQVFGLDTASDIHNNLAPEGGGIAADTNAHIELIGSDMYQNEATSPTGRGGAILLEDGSSLAMSNSTFIYYLNRAYDGAGVYADDSTVSISVGTFRQNIAANHGGAIYLTNNSQLTAVNASIGQDGAWLSNEAQLGAGIFAYQSEIDFQGRILLNAAGTSGGGLYAWESQVRLENTEIYSNTAAVHGAGIMALDATITMGVDDTRCNPALERCSRFSGNTADSDSNFTGYGGAIYSHDSHIDLEQTYIHGNTAARGGALFHEGPAAVANLVNSLFYQNATSQPFGSAVRTENNATITAAHVTLAHNSGGAAFSPSGSTAAVSNSIAWGNSGGGFVHSYVSTACNIDQSGLHGLNINPEFVSYLPGVDYHLSDTSPAIDACSTGHAVDLENMARPAGSGYDIGAYEHAAIEFKVFLPLVLR